MRTRKACVQQQSRTGAAESRCKGLTDSIFFLSLLWVAAGSLVIVLPPSSFGQSAGLIYVEGTSSQLATLNPTNGQITVIGATAKRLGGLGFGSTGELFGLGDDLNLYSVNPATAGLTLIGPTSVNQSGGFAMGATADGMLYAQGAGSLYAINPTNGATTLVGSMGFGTISDLNGDDRGNLYIINNTASALYRVDRSTGAATLVGTGSYGNVVGLGFVNGTMFAMQYYSGTGIYSLNLTNGQSTLVTNYDSLIIGTIYTACCNFQSAPVPSAPALSILVSNFSVATLSWPTNFPGYRLESADGLSGNTWSPVTNNPATNQGQFTVMTEGGNQRYFRLISP